ncbi:MAG: Ig-like domain-containing protein [Candidatus Peribacteraceae bacterium]|nr:Ig-like domain-containing protein [Candidatus Peribacteraceae bacterium]
MELPEPMNRTSVEQHLLIPSDTKGALEWDGDTLVFRPSEPLLQGEKYVFEICKNAQTEKGSVLGRSLSFTFQVSGAPSVASAIPGSGSLHIPATAQISIVFDRPVVALTQAQGEPQATLGTSWPITFDPPLDGRWRWLSTFAAEFIPAKPLTLATRHTVRVPAGIETVNGDKTEKDFTWSFETLRPSVVAADPAPGSRLAGPTTAVSLTFNQPMDADRARTSLSLLRLPSAASSSSFPSEEQRKRGWDIGKDTLLPPSVGSLSGSVVAIKDIHYGTKEEQGKTVVDRATLVLVPAAPLAYASAYGLTVRKGILAREGSLGGTEDYSFTFSTVGPLAVEKAQYQYNALHLVFNNPMDDASLRNGITMSPEPENWDDLDLATSMWGENREISAYPSLQPSTDYVLTVTADAADRFGQRLKEPYVFRFKTDPLPPEVSVRSKGEFGIFERGKPPVFHLNAVNVSRLDLEYAPLPFPDFLAWQRQRRTGGGGTVSLAGRDGMRTWSMPQQNVLNAWQATAFDVQERVGSTLSPGLYALTARAPEYVWQNGKVKEQVVQQQFFAVTNIALTLKFSGSRALVWAVNMNDGSPVSGASVGFHAGDGTVVTGGQTDKDGFFEAPLALADFAEADYEWRPEFYVTAEKDGDIAFLSSEWADGIRPEDFAYPSDFRGIQTPPNRLEAYVYTERPVYAAGDTVHFKAVLRVRDANGTMALPATKKAIVAATDAEGREVYRRSLDISAFGSVNDSFPLDKNASLGMYNLNVQLPPESRTGEVSVGASFSVLAYRKPSYRIDLTPASTDYANRDTVSFDVAASYYFGAPMAGAAVEWRAESTDYHFNRYTDGWYSFATEEHWCWEDCAPATRGLTEGRGALDAGGRMNVSFPVRIDDKGTSQVVSVEADVTDPDNQIVSNRTSVLVHKADVYAGIRSAEYVLTPGQQAKADVVAVRPDGSPVAGQRVTVQLYARTWNTTRKKGVDGQFYYDNRPTDTFIRETAVTTGKDGKAQAALAVDKGGEYRLVAVAADGKGRQSKADAGVYVWSTTFVNWPHSNNDRIGIETDKAQYDVGDTAVLLAKSPYQGKGVKALVTVEREQVIRKQVIDVESSGQAISIPVTEDLAPNAFVSVIILKPRMGETFDEQGRDTGAPAFKAGYVKLNVGLKEKKLDVQVTTDKDTYAPGETVRVSLATADHAGKPVRSELSLGVVDMSLLALAGFEQPDLVRTFWNERSLGVQTSVTILRLLERFKPGSKGGGGGDFETRKRGTFKDTAYWNPSVLTDDQGKASVSFALPDNLTTWKLLAVAQTAGNTFGTGMKDIVETKKVLLRPVRPRFAVRGDEIRIGAIVHNQSGEKKTFTVSLAGSGFALTGKASVGVTVPKDGMEKVEFPVRIGDVARATFLFLAETQDARDEVEETIPVHTFGTPQTVTTSASVEEGVTESVLVPSVRDAADGTLAVTISPTMATYLPTGLEASVQFPYGCTEQTVSAILPSIAVKELQGFQAFKITDDETLRRNVTEAMQKLYDAQRSDGGFGFWAESDESHPYLTSYVLYAMQLTRNAGYAVDEKVMERARTYLQERLRTLDVRNTLDLTARTYILYVLGEGGRSDAGALQAVFEKRGQLPVFARAQLASALHRAGSSVARAQSLAVIRELLNEAKVDPRGTHFEEKKGALYRDVMHTNDRTTALVLLALLRVEPSHPFIPNIVRHLLAVREGGQWDTTQSTTHALLALTEFLRTTEEMDAAFDAAVLVNGNELLRKSFTPQSVLTRGVATLSLDDLRRGALNDVALSKEGKGRLYYDVILTYFYTPETVLPAEEGLSIRRTVQPLQGRDDDASVTAARVGETYRVSLTVTADDDRHFVAVESPLPAGMEAIDFQLQTSQRQQLGGSVKADDKLLPWSEDPWAQAQRRFTHVEFRDDRVFLFAERLPAGIYRYEYLVRATTPGRFRDRPARAWEMYYPETFGQTGGSWFSVTP